MSLGHDRGVNLEADDPPVPSPSMNGVHTDLQCVCGSGWLASLCRVCKAEPPSLVNEAADDPHRLGRLFLAQCCTMNGRRTLVRWRENWLKWDGAGYREVTEDEVRGGVSTTVKAEFDRINLAMLDQWDAKTKRQKTDEKKETKEIQKPTAIKVMRGIITNAMDAIASMTMLKADTEPETWVNEYGVGPRDVIALQNGLLDLRAYFAGSAGCLLTNSPEWFTMSGRPFEFEPGARCPTWTKVINEALEGDAERIAILQEWFGICQVQDTSFHKFLGMEGEGSNSKNVITSALEATVGSRNCSYVPLELFAERFQLTPTLGKLVNIASECSEADRVGEAILKQFVSGDAMLFDRKNKSPLQCRPTARLTFSMNNRPRFNDRSSGLWRRLILMPMRNVIHQEKCIRQMDSARWWIDREEVQGIFVWALEGLRRLRAQDRFTESKVCTEAIAEYRLESNPARQFLDDHCEADPDASVSTVTLYECYNRWSKARGYTPLGDGKFGAEVKRAFSKMRKGQPGRIWTYIGVRFDQFNDGPHE